MNRSVASEIVLGILWTVILSVILSAAVWGLPL